jgi:hypothetical protein
MIVVNSECKSGNLKVAIRSQKVSVYPGNLRLMPLSIKVVLTRTCGPAARALIRSGRGSE